MAKGQKTGGRKKGVPNKLTTTAKAAFMATFGKLEGDLEEWIRSGAALDPLKAAELVVRMAEYHFPKLGRHEVTGKDGGAVVLDFGIDLGRKAE